MNITEVEYICARKEQELVANAKDELRWHIESGETDVHGLIARASWISYESKMRFVDFLADLLSRSVSSKFSALGNFPEVSYRFSVDAGVVQADELLDIFTKHIRRMFDRIHVIVFGRIGFNFDVCYAEEPEIPPIPPAALVYTISGPDDDLNANISDIVVSEPSDSAFDADDVIDNSNECPDMTLCEPEEDDAGNENFNYVEKVGRPKPETASGRGLFGALLGTLSMFSTASVRSLWGRSRKREDVRSSAFAPAEVKRASHFLVQIYLHLEEEEQQVAALAAESDRNAQRREYLPLQLKLKDGDKVDVEFNVYGSDRLMSECKSMIWHGSFTKCSFRYFVPADLDVGQLSCEALLSVNGIPVGEMQFVTDVVDFEPRRLHPEIVSHTFKRIFISYAHEDVRQVRHIALAYKAQGVDYFFDRDTLEPGDIYEEKIFSYIDNSDLFILCWSENAARSPYVAREKSRALSRAYPQCSFDEARLKIFPISIEPRTGLPADMKEIYNFVEV